MWGEGTLVMLDWFLFYRRKGRRNYRQCQQIPSDESGHDFLKVELRTLWGRATCAPGSWRVPPAGWGYRTCVQLLNWSPSRCSRGRQPQRLFFHGIWCACLFAEPVHKHKSSSKWTFHLINAEYVRLLRVPPDILFGHRGDFAHLTRRSSQCHRWRWGFLMSHWGQTRDQPESIQLLPSVSVASSSLSGSF